MEYRQLYNILEGKYTDDDINYVSLYDAYEILKMIREDYGNKGDYEKLQKVLDVVGIKYNKCRKTGLPIAFVKKKVKDKTRVKLDNDYTNYISEDTLDVRYYCPHCGAELPLETDREARLFVRAYLSFEDLGREVDWETPIGVYYKGHYKVDEDVLYYVLASESRKLYKRMLEIVKETKSDGINKIDHFNIDAEIIGEEYAHIVGNGLIEYKSKSEAVSIELAIYTKGRVIYG